ncbi:hypothetical protein NPS53_09775 [Pseudomonas putida]|uniref:hypothetical protein n=1 Tax=Pseudomonas putida TaxID=303 RepID=UPI002363BA1C|nr:hypothetical protein [Pseudomonas putida]MDD2139867.1 hypothetical protein [Pseudomonas putida]HDS1721790.1 hypothetical protein [Pseudomonas putida]
MSNVTTTQNFNAAQQAFAEKMQGRLHAYVKEVVEGRPAVTCIWNETPEKTHKEIVYVGDPQFDALAVVRAANKSMKASVNVVQMLIDLYAAQHKKPVGDGIEF